MGDGAGATLKAEDFHLGADVYSSDGKEVGKLVHVLVDADYRLRAVVVKESGGFAGGLLSPGSLLVADEVIVPREAVKDVTHERVDLALTSPEVRRLPAYLSYREKGETGGEELEDEAGGLRAGPESPRRLGAGAHQTAGEQGRGRGAPGMLRPTGTEAGARKDAPVDGDGPR